MAVVVPGLPARRAPGLMLYWPRCNDKARFWQRHAHTAFNLRQRLVTNKLLDGFEGNLTTAKWAKLAKCSQDTALRDIQDLLGKSILRQAEPGGRSTHYGLAGAISH